MPRQETVRRNEIDWLRVICVLLLVPFHSALVFSLNPRDIVYIKDRVDSPTLVAFAAFLSLWFMPGRVEVSLDRRSHTPRHFPAL